MRAPSSELTWPCLLLLLLAGCGPSGPPLSAADAVAVAPLPGRGVSAAYLTLINDSGAEISIRRVSSPDFTKVEIHESRLVDDLIRMRRLESLVIGAFSSTAFEAGGIHLMLIDPTRALEVGESISLQFEYNAEGILVITVPLTERT